MKKLPEPITAEGNEDVTEKNCRPQVEEHRVGCTGARSTVLQRGTALWLSRRLSTDCSSRPIAAGNDKVGRPLLRLAGATGFGREIRR